jgi:glyoxylase-like metal-dependent hydrolase (beta-lactamase superfamily II)/rhodanese-related sulfurtransferase
MITGDNKSKNDTNLQIKPAELKKRIDSGEDIFILDVRNPEEHESWKVSYDKYQDTPVIPIDALSSSEALKQIPKDKQVVTFCGHGNRSMSAAKMLSEKGYDVKTIEGGLDGWNSVYDITSITDANSSSVNIWQIRRVSKGCMSYMIASLSDKKAVVIDPTCEIDNTISTIVNENDLEITTLIETHMHADHLSGATRLAKKYGSKVYISSLEAYEIKNGHDDGLNFKLIKGGNKIAVGDEIVLEAIHTPGHTNGSMCFKLQVNDVTKTTDNGYESEKNNNKNTHIYLFTGDTIFVDGIGRPDLHNKAEEFTRNLYSSYQQEILNLPDETLILPAHFSSSFEHNKAIFSTIKSIKARMSLLSVPEDKFVRFVTASIPPQPMNYEKITSINKRMTSCDLIEQNDIEAGPNSCGIRA